MSLEDGISWALTEHARDVAAEPDVAALVARGTQARRRRRIAVIASIAATVLVGAIVIGPLSANRAGPAPVVATPSPVMSGEPSMSAGPRTGTVFFAGSANVPVAFTVPPGWEPVNGMSVMRSGDPTVGVGFYDVGNIYADGCRWVQVDPPVGPTVDDLARAYQDQPELRPTPARDITVDGFAGKRLQFSVPAHDAASCKEGTYALVQVDNAGTNTVLDGAPNLWAMIPEQQHDVLILDVDGTRLGVYAVYPADLSAQDRAELDTVLGSLQIG